MRNHFYLLLVVSIFFLFSANVSADLSGVSLRLNELRDLRAYSAKPLEYTETTHYDVPLIQTEDATISLYEITSNSFVFNIENNDNDFYDFSITNISVDGQTAVAETYYSSEIPGGRTAKISIPATVTNTRHEKISVEVRRSNRTGTFDDGTYYAFDISLGYPNTREYSVPTSAPDFSSDVIDVYYMGLLDEKPVYFIKNKSNDVLELTCDYLYVNEERFEIYTVYTILPNSADFIAVDKDWIAESITSIPESTEIYAKFEGEYNNGETETIVIEISTTTEKSE